MWRRVMPQLARRYTVVAPDLRGLGDSSRPSGGYDKRTAAGDIHALIQRLGVGRVHLVGHDIGAMVAFSHAVAFPEAVTSLVLMEAGIPGFGLEESMDMARGGRWQFGFHALPNLPEALVAGREHLYLSWWFWNRSVNPNAILPRDIDEYARCYSAPGALRAGFDYYRTLLSDGIYNRSRDIRLDMPVLAIGGEEGVGSSLAEALGAVAPDLRGAVIPDCAHYVPEEQPEALLILLADFFERCR